MMNFYKKEYGRQTSLSEKRRFTGFQMCCTCREASGLRFKEETTIREEIERNQEQMFSVVDSDDLPAFKRRGSVDLQIEATDLTSTISKMGMSLIFACVFTMAISSESVASPQSGSNANAAIDEKSNKADLLSLAKFGTEKRGKKTPAKPAKFSRSSPRAPGNLRNIATPGSASKKGPGRASDSFSNPVSMKKGSGKKNQGKSSALGTAEEGSGPWSDVKNADEMAVNIEFKKPKRGTKFSFNLVDADLIELIKIIGNITGKSFILGGKIPNVKATIYAPTKITAAEAYQAFLSVLQVNGLTVVPAGRYLKILSVSGATSYNTPILKKVAGNDQIVTQLHQLEHVSAEELSSILDRFKSSDGDITVYAPTNTLIITDYGNSIKRLLKLLALLDVPGTGEQIWVEPVNYADASELADRITEIFDTGNGSGSSKKAPSSKPKKKRKTKKSGRGPTGMTLGENEAGSISKILPDERTNSLIIVSSEVAYLRILELMKVLDVPIAGEGTLHVHKLQHADADELAKTLSNLSKRTGSTKKKKSKSSGASGDLFEGNMQISADKATNSLVIVSSLRDYMSLKSVIDVLDSMQRQVFVEAVIMEVSLDKNRDIGLGFHAGNVIGSGDKESLIYGSSQPNDSLNSLLMGPGALSGLAAGVRGPELEGTEDLLGAGISIPAFGVALHALQTNSDVNVLSTPHILATDNVEASITVGENVPVQQGYSGGASMLNQLSRTAGMDSGASAAMSMIGGYGGMGGMMGGSIGRQNVGLTLKVTPYINDDNQVRLEIDLEISEVKSLTDLGPNISKQNAKTTSVVADQQTIVIGGLITDNQVQTTTKVPVLGDIPILGMLFRHKVSLTKKRNLLIFLTPYIIRTPEDFRDIFKRKMAERREFIERYTAFEYHRYDPHLDWSRTNGAISVITKVVSEAQRNEQLRRDSETAKEDDHSPKESIKFPQRATAENEAPGTVIIKPTDTLTRR